jgi:hypothetical protein
MRDRRADSQTRSCNNIDYVIDRSHMVELGELIGSHAWRLSIIFKQRRQVTSGKTTQRNH